MMNAPEIFPYSLRARSPMNARHAGTSVSGVLVRSAGGHACLQAWESLGDAPLAEHVASLAGGHPTLLADRALAAAADDAAARLAGRSLFDGLVIPPSHATIIGPMDPTLAESWLARGFDSFKVKLDAAWRVAMPGVLAAAAAHPHARWRFDFNASIDANEALAWMRSLPDALRAATDFVEDPVRFLPVIGRSLRRLAACVSRQMPGAPIPRPPDFSGSANPRVMTPGWSLRPRSRANDRWW